MSAVALAVIAVLVASLRNQSTVAVGLLAVVGGVLGIALMIGIGRAGLGPGHGLEPRYAILMVPVFVVGHLAFVATCHHRLGQVVSVATLLLLMGLTPYNVDAGREYGQMRQSAATTVASRITAGVHPDLVATGFTETLYYGPESRLRGFLTDMEASGCGPFSDVPWSRVIRVAIAPSLAHDLEMRGNTVHPTGSDPYVVFELSGHVHAIRLLLRAPSSSGPLALQAFWRRGQEFSEAERTFRDVVPLAGDPRWLTIPVQDEIDEFRLDFGIGDREVEILAIEVLVY
jgi:hypothetical protein